MDPLPDVAEIPISEWLLLVVFGCSIVVGFSPQICIGLEDYRRRGARLTYREWTQRLRGMGVFHAFLMGICLSCLIIIIVGISWWHAEHEERYSIAEPGHIHQFLMTVQLYIAIFNFLSIGRGGKRIIPHFCFATLLVIASGASGYYWKNADYDTAYRMYVVVMIFQYPFNLCIISMTLAQLGVMGPIARNYPCLRYLCCLRREQVEAGQHRRIPIRRRHGRRIIVAGEVDGNNIPLIDADIPVVAGQV